jgi:hypothetical protein
MRDGQTKPILVVIAGCTKSCWTCTNEDAALVETEYEIGFVHLPVYLSLKNEIERASERLLIV